MEQEEDGSEYEETYIVVDFAEVAGSEIFWKAKNVTLTVSFQDFGVNA